MKRTKPKRSKVSSAPFRRIEFRALNSRQKENYNFAKLSSVMADYGFNLLRLSDDWNGADAIAVHISGKNHLRVQLKGTGLVLGEKYRSKSIWIACKSKSQEWYMYPHDEVLAHAGKKLSFLKTDAWRSGRYYTWPDIPKEIRDYLERKGYRLS